MYLVNWTLEATLTTESNGLSEKLALPPHRHLLSLKVSCFFNYNNLIPEFALSSVTNSNKLYLDTLTNLQQSSVSMFYEKRVVQNKNLVSVR